MDGQRFFWLHIGHHLGLAEAAPIKLARPAQRVKEGVKPLSIGQMDTFYIVSEPVSMLIGRIDEPEVAALKFVPTEKVSARKFLAEWLIEDATAPFMIGVIGKAHPEPSFKITGHPALSYFCDTAGSFSFNLEVVKTAHQLIGDLPWATVIRPAIYAYSDYLGARQGHNQKEKDRLNKLLGKNPELTGMLPKLNIRPNSGEYKILSWLNIDRKGKEDA